MADKPLPAFPGAGTPGWNDPPTLQYSPTAGTTSGRPRINLNKRVAFPLQGTTAATAAKPTAIVQPNQIGSSGTTGSGSGPQMSMPLTSAAGTAHPVAVVHPMPHNTNPVSTLPPPPPPQTSSITSRGMQPTVPATVIAPNSDAYQPLRNTTIPADADQFTLRTMREQLGAVVENEPTVRRDEIERRLEIVGQLWQSGNLSAAMQEKLYRLSKAIAEKSYNDAMDIYTTLVANHSNECSTWAIAIRHIVLTLQPNDNTDEVQAAVTRTTTTTAPTAMATSVTTNIAIVPAMYVPAMPRISGTSSNANASTAGCTSVQHI